MDRRSKLGDVREAEVPKTVERSPLIDPRKLRSCRSTPASRSLCRSACTETKIVQRASSKGSYSLKTISEFELPNVTPSTLNRSRSAPFPSHSMPCPNRIRSPQYRVNPIVKFSDRPVPERMNYGIAGYNTTRRRSCSSLPESTTSRPRSFSGTVSEFSKRPRSFSSVSETKSSLPRSCTGIPERAMGFQTRSVLWRSWTRRFRDKMGRVRVRDTCSKLLSRFRGGHL